MNLDHQFALSASIAQAFALENLIMNEALSLDVLTKNDALSLDVLTKNELLSLDVLTKNEPLSLDNLTKNEPLSLDVLIQNQKLYDYLTKILEIVKFNTGTSMMIVLDDLQVLFDKDGPIDLYKDVHLVFEWLLDSVNNGILQVINR
jgi:hypothetical protein